MSEIMEIPLASLLVDEENPRIPTPNAGQRETQRMLAKHQQEKLSVLAEDIVQHGLNPAELGMVVNMDDGRYVVVEGNRRITALHALENPDLLSGAVSKGVLSKFRKLSQDYHKNPVESISCIVFDHREEAKHWIELRHTGEVGGAGIIPWISVESTRFRSRYGKPSELHMQVLEFLKERDDLDDKRIRSIPTTSLKRLVETPGVRSELGIDVDNGYVMLMADQRKVAKALMYVINDLADTRIKTEDIYTKEKRIAYATGLPTNIKVKPTRKPGEGVPATAEGAEATTKRTTSRRKTTKTIERDVLIPQDCVLGITNERLKDIESELRKLSLKKHPNAVSVLLRVFLELSVDDYMDRNALPIGEREPLAKKFRTVANHLKSKNKLNRQQANAVLKACVKGSFLAPSVNLMHQFVHNQHIFPIGSELRAHWNSLQPFVKAIWSP